MASEEWRDVPGWGGKYRASTLGRIWSNYTGRLMRPDINNVSGYYYVSFSHPRKVARLNRIIALTFHGEPPPDHPHVNHKDGDKGNNATSNLEYVSPRENSRHAAANGLMRHGSRCWAAKLSEADVREVMELRRAGWSAKRIADRFGLKYRVTVQNIWLGRTWNHVTGLPRKSRRTDRERGVL